MKFNIRNEREVQKQLKKMAYVLKTGELGERVFLKQYRNLMVREFSVRASEARDYIRTVKTTETGRERKANGGKYAGRDTTGAETGGGAMAKSFKLNPKTGSYQAGGKYTFAYGFIDAPRYTIFQEYGTRGGIEAMNVLMNERASMEDIVAEVIGRGGRRYDFLDIVEGDIKVLRKQNFTSNFNGLPELG